METERKNYFQELNDIDVSKYVEKKNDLTYLSWSYAWAETKKRYPDAQYKIYERIIDDYGNTVNYFTDGRTCWVKVSVTINGLDHIVELPVMDYKNKSIPLDQVTSYDVNKSIQRCMTKAIAMHGIGLYIYAGEDLPEAVADENKAKTEELAKHVKEVVDAGGKLIKSGLDKNAMMAIVAKYNDGNGNPSGIKTVEIAEAIMKEFTELAKKNEKEKKN